MGDWEEIQYGFNAFDETINFGTRHLAGLDNLFETTTLATIRNTSSDTEQSPTVCSVIINGSIYFSINNIFRIFENLLCSKLSFSAVFEYDIDTFCTANDGNLLLVCFRNGHVSLLMLGETQECLCEKTIFENEDSKQFFINVFCETQEKEIVFYLLSRNGMLHRFTSPIQIVSDMDEEEFKLDLIVDLKTDVQSGFFIYPSLLYTDSTYITLYNVEDQETISEQIIDFKRIYQYTRTTCIGLTNEGKLLNICMKTNLMSPINIDTLFEDFLLIIDKNDVYFLTVTKKNELGILYVQLMLYQEFNIIFSIEITEIIHFIIPEHISDEVMYIAEIRKGESVNELRFQTVSETVAEHRLQRLLRRQKFDDAEQFAKLFNLDVVEIQKARAQMIVDKSVSTKEDISNLINILDGLEDDGFKIMSCLEIHAQCTDMNDVEKVLKYMNLIPLSTTNQNLQEIASELWLRFQTFLMLVNNNSYRNTVQSWAYFYNCNLISEMHLLLEQGKWEEWRIIYSRLDATTSEKLCEEDVVKILTVINKFTLEEQTMFLNTFIPLTLQFLPSAINSFINWMIVKVEFIEELDSKRFPENALSFLNKFIKLLKVETSSKLTFHQQFVINMDSLKEMESIVDTLKKVKSLKDDHRVILPYQEMLQGTECLVKALLCTLNYDFKDEKFFEDFIVKFILNSSSNPDDLFGDIINDIVKYEEEYWIKIVLILLNYITSLDKKLEAILVVVKAARLPWCNSIRDIALNSLKYSHPLVDSIRHEIQEEPSRCIFRKEPYNINYMFESTLTFLEFAFNRIIYCNQPTMVEDIYQICKNQNEKALADFLLIGYFIEVGDFKKALKILDNSAEGVIKCSIRILRSITTILDIQGWKRLENYFQIIECIVGRLQNASEFVKQRYKDTVDDLKCIYYIHKTWNLNIKLNDFYKQPKQVILKEVISNVVEEYNISNDIIDCISKCESVASHLRLKNDCVFYELCKNIGDFQVILDAANVVYESTNDSKVLCKIVTLILEQIGTSEINLKVSEIQSLCDYENVDIKPFISGLQLARKIVTKAIINSSVFNIVYCLELGNWVETTYCLIRTNAEGRACDEDPILPSISVFNAIKSTFYCYTYFKNPISSKIKQETLDNNIMLSENKIVMEIRELQSTIASLASEGNTQIAYKLIETLLRSLMFHSNIENEVREHLIYTLRNCADHLIKHIFSSSSIDVNLTLHLLIICNDLSNSKQLLFRNLKRYKRNLYKFEKIAEVALLYLKYNNIEDGQILCKNILCLAKWWKQLKRCHIPYEEFFRLSPEVVILKLIKFNDLTIDMIHDFCLSINLNVEDCYKLHLETLLLKWKPDYTISTNSYGVEYVIMKHNGVEYVEQCMEVIQLIEDRQSVFSLLDSTWEKINFYHYEVFLCVLELLSMLNQTNYNKQRNIILSFLSSYIRVGKPGEAEKEQWFTLYPDTQCLDPLSKWRIPFTPTLTNKDIWSIIRPEINLKTYQHWFGTTSVLKHLNKNDICSYVIKDIISSGVFQSEKSDRWLIHSKHEDLLYEIDRCVENISNLELATSALYSLLTNIPPGADLVRAARLCYAYALKYQEQNPNSDDIQKAVTKVQKKYIQFSTTHILHINHLAERKYLDMVSGSVDDLIESLYMDKRILLSIGKVDLHCPDINKAVEQLALLHDIDIEEKRKELLNNWLSVHSVSLSLSNKSLSEYNYKNEFLIRASYLCLSGDINYWQSHLLSLGNIEENASKHLGFRAMALKCFCNVSNTETIENLTGLSYEDFRDYVNKLSLISALENFGFCLTIETLDEQSKGELLSRLSHRMNNNNLAINIMASICITYGIYEAKYWRIITTAMIKTKMFEEVKESILFLKKNIALYNCQWYIDIWQQVIHNSFSLISNLNKNVVRNTYIENFFFIQNCPVLFSIDLEIVSKKCLEMGQHDLVLLSLQYLKKDLHHFYLKKLYKLNVSISDSIAQLNSLGFWGITYVKEIATEFRIKENGSCDI